MKFLKLYFTFVGHFCPLDPDPDSGYGSTDLIESGSETLAFCWLWLGHLKNAVVSLLRSPFFIPIVTAAAAAAED
jgi:hypothetical protein